MCEEVRKWVYMLYRAIRTELIFQTLQPREEESVKSISTETDTYGLYSADTHLYFTTHLLAISLELSLDGSISFRRLGRFWIF